MSLPEEIFYPIGQPPCALVLRAHDPHEISDAPTWFGYWRDDGFIKVKNQGRVDYYHRWDNIRARWLADFRAGAEHPGRCVKRRVTVTDEWCAEAYLETDYSVLQKEDFENALKEYALFVIKQSIE